MALADALYSIMISGGRSLVKTRTDFSVSDWNPSTNRLVTLDNMIFATALELTTNSPLVDDANGPIWLELYASPTDESSFIWALPITSKYKISASAADRAANRNFWHFFQPLRVNTLYAGIRKVHPYPDTHGGSLVDMSADPSNWLLTVMQTPRNFA